MSQIQLHCFQCGKITDFIDAIGIRDECEHCHADAHCCKNCEFYDVKVYNECRETSAEVVREKERANFCDYFKLGRQGKNAVLERDQLRAAAEALFKRKN